MIKTKDFKQYLTSQDQRVDFVAPLISAGIDTCLQSASMLLKFVCIPSREIMKVYIFNKKPIVLQAGLDFKTQNQ